MSWSDFLAYLSQPNGIAVVVGALLSVILEYWPKFGTLAPRYKRAAFFVLCMVVPLVGAALGILTADWPAGFETTFWPALVAGFMAFASGTMLHIREMR
jgi:hypothetical protein